MITIHIKRKPQTEEITAFTISGHAGYADKGYDIICAAISGITFGTVNAIEQLLDVKLDAEMEEETGFLHCIVPLELEESIQEKVQLLLEAMQVSLESIATTEEYKLFVKITNV